MVVVVVVVVVVTVFVFVHEMVERLKVGRDFIRNRVVSIEGRAPPKAAALAAKFGEKFPCNLRLSCIFQTR